MRPITMRLVLVATLCAVWISTAQAKTLDIYFIDVEGGQSTLVVTPSGQSLLIDTGFPGDGSAGAKAGDPEQSRDARRIAAAVEDAGLSHIDYLLITHFHADHVGGAPELAQLLPIYAFIDHGSVGQEADANVPGTFDVFKAYTAVRARGRHINPKVGDRIPLKGVDAIIVSSDRQTLAKPLAGADGPNAACGASGRDAQDPNENPRSTGIHLRYGKFSFLDLGDLSGAPLFALVCPNDMIGAVSAYLVAHHAGADVAEPAVFAALKPRVAILNNGFTKGGALDMFKLLQQLPRTDVWQLHLSKAAGDANFPLERIANPDESTAHWIKLSAKDNGSFKIQNGRTGVWKTYGKR